MLNYLMILLVSFYFSSPAFAGTGCEAAFKQLQSVLAPVSVNLKRAQELAEPYVNRKIASEVLTDPGVEAALQDSVSVKRDERAVAEAIEEALLARGMSDGQAKKAAQGWTQDMKSEDLLGKAEVLSEPVNMKRAQELAEPYVNRKIASEVLTDPGVEAALQESEGVQEAIQEALLARGMSEGQAKKAAQGWTQSLKNEGLLRD